MTSRKIAGVTFWIIVTALPIIGVILALTDPKVFTATQDHWQSKIATAGIFGPLIFIFIQAVQVVITPISHYSLGLIGGFLYGPYLGGLFNWFGRIIGHLLAFFLARTIGRPIVDKFVTKETLDTYDKHVSNKSLVLFLFYFLPLFPDDEMSYLAGLSKMKFRMFFFANIFGHVGGSLGLAYIGSGIDTKDPLFWFLFASTLTGFPLVWWLLQRSGKNV